MICCSFVVQIFFLNSVFFSFSSHAIRRQVDWAQCRRAGHLDIRRVPSIFLPIPSMANDIHLALTNRHACRFSLPKRKVGMKMPVLKMELLRLATVAEARAASSLDTPARSSRRMKLSPAATTAVRVMRGRSGADASVATAGPTTASRLRSPPWPCGRIIWLRY